MPMSTTGFLLVDRNKQIRMKELQNILKRPIIDDGFVVDAMLIYYLPNNRPC
jgi:hypothetical protein